MRFLKRKIANARFGNGPRPEEVTQNHNDEPSTQVQPTSKRRRLPGFSFTPEKVKVTKNIVINYAKAISSFAISKLALVYLEPLAAKEEVEIALFQEHVKSVKNSIGGICSFRTLLLIDEKDSRKEAAYKRIYQALCEIFIKCFSVNWITYGKMGHKDVYLKYRFKMLRRIKDPKSFTYLKS